MARYRILLNYVKRILWMTPTRQVFRELSHRGVDLKALDALEVFGGSGDFHVREYASFVRSLTVWEINQGFYESLKKNLPSAQIKITDSFQELRKETKRYGLIVVDNPMSTFNGHCEHFDLFPYIFQVASNSTVIIVNVIPKIDEIAKLDYPYLFNPAQLERRRSFYNTDKPEDVSFDNIVRAYGKIANSKGFVLDWFFTQKRTFVYYLVLKCTFAHYQERIRDESRSQM